jgi:succinate dehydrogenase / fumarate reductase iron-sulfur subunit
MNLTLQIWRQKDANSPGRLVEYKIDAVSPDCSFLEMLDLLNEQLIGRGEEPVAFDHDCREGICGMCGMVIKGAGRARQ